MSALPPYNAAGRCPKCGGGPLGTRYLRDNRAAQYGGVAWKADLDVFPCMQRHCSVCQFETLEAPLSASDTLTAPSPAAQADVGKPKLEWTPMQADGETDYGDGDI